MLAVAQARQEVRRFLAPGVAVALGVAFFAATVILGASLSSAITVALAGDLQTYAAVVTAPGSAPLTSIQRQAVTDLPGVQDVVATRAAEATLSGRRVNVQTPPAPTSAARLSEGRAPATDDEVTVSLGLARATGIGIGAEVVLQGLSERGASARPVTVVGIVDAARDPRYGMGRSVVFMTDEGFVSALGDNGFLDLRVKGRGAGLVTAVAQAVGGTVVVGGDFSGVFDGPLVQSGADAAFTIVEGLGRASMLITSLVLALVAVSLIVCGVVVANTFAILLTRRTREIALVRCVGATRGQVMRQVLVESALLGVGFSALGVLIGVGLAVAAGVVADRAGVLGGSLRIELPWWGLVAALVAGLVVTVLAAVVPAARASRTGPLDGLHPSGPVNAGSRAGRIRVIVGVALMAGGGLLLMLGANGMTLLVAFPGGALSVAGILLLLTPVVPILVRGLGRPLPGVTGELTVENITRTPGRAAATVTALFVGVALVTTTLVGGLTARRSINELTDRENVVDLAVLASSSTLPVDAGGQLALIDGVSTVAGVTGATIDVAGRGPRSVVGLGPDLATVSHDADVAAAYGPGHLVVGSDHTDGMPPAGRSVTVTGDRGSRDLTVVVDDRLGFATALSTQDLASVTSSGQPVGVLLRLAPDAALDTVIGDVDRLASGWHAELGGSAPRRAQIESTLRIVMGVIVGLLALSVAISLVGVGNTLALSVHERARETALLRALGTTRGQIRRMLALEGGLLAGVGTVLGILAGVGYGVAGAAALMGTQVPLAIDIPWLLLAAIALGALATGVLASALPGRRAVAASPAELLAQE